MIVVSWEFGAALNVKIIQEISFDTITAPQICQRNILAVVVDTITAHYNF